MEINDFKSVISLWPTTKQLAEDLGESYANVRQWRRRNRIPATHWDRLVQAARRRKFPYVSHSRLARLARSYNA